jgi:hypothetical protein
MKHPMKLSLLLVMLSVAGGCDKQGCASSSRLDQLLGGGAPLCLGGSWSQVNDHLSKGKLDSMGWFGIDEGRRSYKYIPGGGIDLIVFRPGGVVAQGCVSEPSSEAASDSLAQSIMEQMGTNWRRSSAPQAVTRWVSTEGFLVSVREDKEYELVSTCVASQAP